MFEDLEETSNFNPQSVKESPPQSNSGGGGYQNRSGGGGNGYERKPFNPKDDPVQAAYIPVAFYVEKDFPDDVKNTVFNLATKLMSKGITVRINGDDKPLIDKLRGISQDKVEVYLPWREFNGIDSKKTYNTNTSKDIASKHFPAWEKIPDSVKAILASQVRLIFGDRNNSITLCLLTWSRDGASKGSEVTKDTGRAGFVIKTASFYGFPVLNLSKPQAIPMLEKTFGL